MHCNLKPRSQELQPQNPQPQQEPSTQQVPAQAGQAQQGLGPGQAVGQRLDGISGPIGGVAQQTASTKPLQQPQPHAQSQAQAQGHYYSQNRAFQPQPYQQPQFPQGHPLQMQMQMNQQQLGGGFVGGHPPLAPGLVTGPSYERGLAERPGSGTGVPAVGSPFAPQPSVEAEVGAHPPHPTAVNGFVPMQAMGYATTNSPPPPPPAGTQP